MSLRAMLWALHDAPVDDPQATLILLGLADHAHNDGSASFPSRSALARYGRCSVATVDRRVRDLLDRGVIRLGDQQLVAHFPGNRRPVVYDLAVHLLGAQAAPPEPSGAANDAARGIKPADQGPQLCGTNQELKPRTNRARASGGALCPVCVPAHRMTVACLSSSTRPAPADLRERVRRAQER